MLAPECLRDPTLDQCSLSRAWRRCVLCPAFCQSPPLALGAGSVDLLDVDPLAPEDAHILVAVLRTVEVLDNSTDTINTDKLRGKPTGATRLAAAVTQPPEGPPATMLCRTRIAQLNAVAPGQPQVL